MKKGSCLALAAMFFVTGVVVEEGVLACDRDRPNLYDRMQYFRRNMQWNTRGKKGRCHSVKGRVNEQEKP